VFGRELARCGGERIVEKTPSNCLRVAFIRRVFPDAYFLHITRDGREAVPAIMDKWRNKTTGVSGEPERRRVLRRIREAPIRQVPYYLPELVGRMLPMGEAQVWGPRLPGLRDMARDLPLLEVAAAQWRACVEGVLHERQNLGDRYHELRLETLDEAALSDALEAVGLPRQVGVFEEFSKRFDKQKVGGRFEQLPEAEATRLEMILGPTLRDLGYSR
jgi:hypothetical protein